jgi:hypothetical protein
MLIGIEYYKWGTFEGSLTEAGLERSQEVNGRLSMGMYVVKNKEKFFLTVLQHGIEFHKFS